MQEVQARVGELGQSRAGPKRRLRGLVEVRGNENRLQCEEPHGAAGRASGEPPPHVLPSKTRYCAGGGAKKETPRMFSSIRNGLCTDGNARAWQSVRSHMRHVIPIGTASFGLSS